MHSTAQFEQITVGCAEHCKHGWIMNSTWQVQYSKNKNVVKFNWVPYFISVWLSFIKSFGSLEFCCYFARLSYACKVWWWRYSLKLNFWIYWPEQLQILILALLQMKILQKVTGPDRFLLAIDLRTSAKVNDCDMCKFHDIGWIAQLNWVAALQSIHFYCKGTWCLYKLI